MDASFRLSLRDRLADVGAEGHLASFLLHASLLFMFATAMATMGEDEQGDITRERIAQMRAYLGEAESGGGEAASAALTDGQPGLGDPRTPPGRDGNGRRMEPGTRAAATQARASAKGSAAPEDAKLARAREVEEAATFGLVGVLLTVRPSDQDAPVNAWSSLLDGADGASHMGNAWAPTIGDAFGVGLGLTGGGEGGGGRGRGEGVGVGGFGFGTLSTCGEVHCVGTAGAGGYADGIGRLGGRHTTKVPTVRCGRLDPVTQEHVPGSCTASINGRLPPEAVQRVVRQNFGRFRVCYEDHLRASPSLAGRVAVKFVIDREGSVATAQDGGSDLPDTDTVACVVRAFSGLSFPKPEGGIVTVLYPLVFSPPGD